MASRAWCRKGFSLTADKHKNPRKLLIPPPCLYCNGLDKRGNTDTSTWSMFIIQFYSKSWIVLWIKCQSCNCTRTQGVNKNNVVLSDLWTRVWNCVPVFPFEAEKMLCFSDKFNICKDIFKKKNPRKLLIFAALYLLSQCLWMDSITLWFRNQVFHQYDWFISVEVITVTGSVFNSATNGFYSPVELL